MADNIVASIEAALEHDHDINLHRFPVQVSRDVDQDAIRLEGTVEDICPPNPCSSVHLDSAGRSRCGEPDSGTALITYAARGQAQAVKAGQAPMGHIVGLHQHQLISCQWW